MRRWCGVAVAWAACSMLPGCAAQSGPIQVRDDQFRPYREYTTGPVRAGTYQDAILLELNG